MSCNCPAPVRAPNWTPIPEFKNQPTEILPGENIDCYMARAGNTSGLMDDSAAKSANKIDNTSVTSDLNGKVNEKFEITAASTEPATSWRIWVNGSPGLPNGFGPLFNTQTGALTGTVAEPFLNKQYEIEIKAFNAAGNMIDSRKLSFFPKKASNEPKGDTIKFVMPYAPSSKAVVTSVFGPRSGKQHNGIDIAQPGRVIGTILAAADGEVIRVGPGAGWGNVIFIAHKDSKNTVIATTVYGHWSEAYVKVGQKVAAGQPIAKEGNVGVSRGPHLHFEMHMANFRKPVDPLPYINGKFAVNNDVVPEIPGTAGNASAPKQAPTSPVPSQVQTRTNTNRGVTSKESAARQSGGCDDLTTVAPASNTPGGPTTPSYSGPCAGNPSPATPPVPVQPPPPEVTPPGTVPPKITPQEAYAQAKAVLDADPRLTPADREHLLFVAKIESNFKADAKNPTSSATGLYQMLDKTAGTYYKKIGAIPSAENRADPTLATKAQVEFYLKEQKPYWNEYVTSGGTKIAGKTLSAATQAKYAAMNLTQGEFTYGLIHHDGVGNAVNGNDRQGVDYYRKKSVA